MLASRLTWWAEVSGGTEDGVVDDDYTDAVVAVVPAGTRLAGPLGRQVLVGATGAEQGRVAVLRAVVTPGTGVGGRQALPARAVVTAATVTCNKISSLKFETELN